MVLRALQPADFAQWSDVRIRNAGWLIPWEPLPSPGAPDVVRDRDAFTARCRSRDRERQLGTGYGYAIEHEGRVVGEINLNVVQRGPFQNAYLGYWIDEAVAGQGLMPESVVVVLCHAFEDLGLHRVQIAIIPRNQASRRVVEKLDIREEGTALRYLQINGVWEDHVRYAVTVEDWFARRKQLLEDWVLPDA